MYFTYELQKISKSENANKIQNLVEKLRILNRKYLRMSFEKPC